VDRPSALLFVTGDKIKALSVQEKDITFTMEQEEYFVPYENEVSCVERKTANSGNTLLRVVSSYSYVTSDPETRFFIR